MSLCPKCGKSLKKGETCNCAASKPASAAKRFIKDSKNIIILLLAAIVLLLAVICVTNNSNGISIYQSDRKAEKVEIKKVNGQSEMTPAEVYASTVNATVFITNKTNSGSTDVGSGFIISNEGYIVTNAHVIANASEITVELYCGDTYTATVIGSDTDHDVAVIKIEEGVLPSVTLGNSDNMNVGDWVMAIGNPFGELHFSMSQGSISRIGPPSGEYDTTLATMLQTDCPINPGNSGGPLLNLYGEVVGIASAHFLSATNTSGEGLGFAIPISDVQDIITDMIETNLVNNSNTEK